mmetsp:Transcript_6290/g.8336  ORF Transcript_6290/g.8336 Transcript_6290/m.8336 type:complete len:1062 (-) Transcript_6290:158-3343(-)|eukprot:CAMPEP_0117744072 /NCGR_PEP_ID=MMETSP0947-20121206/6528_1 /TAXON_ID=44440 /ORGANISM="Chattonella subsalsa, Strain CCMP2191" /LENGTH=1061 /DNA_ID=CAMNT_0005560925 /DNA_START=202 /DNA_END=3390 /DNA_ORIENTATION=-
MGCVNSSSKKERRRSGAGPHGNTAAISKDARKLSEIDPELEERNENITASVRTEHLDYGKYGIDYAFVSQRGYYPDAPDKANQDSYCIVTNLFGDPKKGLFAVLDGHGKDGDLCSIFCKNQLPVNFEKFVKDNEDTHAGMTKAFTTTNVELHKAPKIDDSLSGTTAIAVYIDQDDVYVANVGDSRAIIGVQVDNKLVAKPLSSDQTPYRKDERDRVKACGARVMSMDQIEGFEPIHENWGNVNLGEEIDEGGDPPRVWSQYGEYPGTAFTRSFGDMIAEELGVCAEPEILHRKISKGDRYIVIASDGVFEFITNQTVIDMVEKFQDPLEACRKIVQEAYDLWLQYEVRTDDITMICLRIVEAEGEQLTLRRISTFEGPVESAKPNARRQYSREKKKQLIAAARAEETEVDIQKYITKKSKAEKTRILEAIKSCFLFENISKQQADMMCKVMELVHVNPGEVLIRQGDEGDKFYVIDNGKFEVRIAQTQEEIDSGNLGPVVHVYDSDGTTHPSFGELALMYSKPRGASVVAVSVGQLWALARPVFKYVLTQQSSKKDLIHTLRRVNVFQSLTINQLEILAGVVRDVHFSEKQVIIRQGDPGDCMYVIQSGKAQVQVTDAETGKQKIVASMGQYDYFGERALLSDEPRTASIVAETAITLLRIDKEAFEDVLGRLQLIIEEHARRREVADRQQPKDLVQPFYQLQRFGILAEDEIGVLQICSFSSGAPTPAAKPKDGSNRGASFFGTFTRQLSSNDTTRANGPSSGGVRRTYTLRTMWKNEVEEKNQTDMVMQGIQLARELKHSAHEQEDCITVPQLMQTYKDTNFLHALFDVTISCDINTVLTEKALSNDSIQHSAACVLLGLEYIHKVGIKYRGISLELLYLDHKGFTVLMEYRFAKAGLGRSSTMCGDPDFLPPEMVAQRGSGVAQDFWALGVYIYTAFCGNTPFEASREVDLYANITNFRPNQLTFPDGTPSSLKNLVEGLLNPDPKHRLGCTGNGISALKSHRWFAGINWDQLQSGTQTNSDLLEISQQKITESINKSDSVSSVDKIFVGDDRIFADF